MASSSAYGIDFDQLGAGDEALKPERIFTPSGLSWRNISPSAAFVPPANAAVMRMMSPVIRASREAGCKIGICGQAPSESRGGIPSRANL